jgi:uncharacterized membrane protein YgcG
MHAPVLLHMHLCTLTLTHVQLPLLSILASARASGLLLHASTAFFFLSVLSHWVSLIACCNVPHVHATRRRCVCACVRVRAWVRAGRYKLHGSVALREEFFPLTFPEADAAHKHRGGGRGGGETRGESGGGGGAEDGGSSGGGAEHPLVLLQRKERAKNLAFLIR